MHFLAAVPLEHLVWSLLHSDGLLLLLLDERFQEVTFGLEDELAPQLGLVVLSAHPFSVGDFHGFGLKLKDFGGVRGLTGERWGLDSWFTAKTAFGLPVWTFRCSIIAWLLYMIANEGAWINVRSSLVARNTDYICCSSLIDWISGGCLLLLQIIILFSCSFREAL